MLYPHTTSLLHFTLNDWDRSQALEHAPDALDQRRSRRGRTGSWVSAASPWPGLDLSCWVRPAMESTLAAVSDAEKTGPDILPGRGDFSAALSVGRRWTRDKVMWESGPLGSFALPAQTA